MATPARNFTNNDTASETEKNCHGSMSPHQSCVKKLHVGKTKTSPMPASTIKQQTNRKQLTMANTTLIARVARCIKHSTASSTTKKNSRPPNLLADQAGETFDNELR